MTAMKVDLGPVLGDLGMWTLKAMQDQAKERGDNDLKKRLQVCYDIVDKFLENQFEVLGVEKKYQFLNKFGPKKCPD